MTHVDIIPHDDNASTIKSKDHLKFVAPRDRDAWSAIRGFVYQVDLTIERWLNLVDDQELYLEAGEDIDTVSKYLQDGSEERLLEQIKHREKNLTLKSESALSALANAVEHFQNDTKNRLIFRYTTNAVTGKEHLSPFSAHGICEWERLRSSNFDKQLSSSQLEKEIENILFGIRKILIGVKNCPKELNKETWGRFRVFIETSHDSSLLDLIMRFEWSVGAPEAKDMCDRIQSTLMDLGHAADEVTAQNQYQKLFLHVFKTISKRGDKKLCINGLPNVLLQQISANDRLFFEQFSTEMGIVAHKLAIMHTQMSQIEQEIGKVASSVSRLVELSNVHQLSMITPIPIFQPPPLDSNLSPRFETVVKLKQELDQVAWLAITGSSGMGKSSVALLIAAKVGCCPVWLRFRDLDVERAAAELDAVFLYINSGTPFSNHLQKYIETCQSFTPGSVIVLDDIPALSNGDRLVQRLEFLLTACKKTNVKILTTSVHRQPGHLQRIARGHFTEVTVPALTDLDALEILKIHNAPNHILCNINTVRFLNAIARQHPTLLVAVALFLGGNNWEWTDQHLENLLQGRFAEEVNDETIQRLLSTVTDDISRKLLYRLNLIVGAFNIETVRIVAAIHPQIPEPRERLTALNGLWIQRDSEELMRVSPLIHTLGSDDLNNAVKLQCNHTLANQILQKRNLSPHDLEIAILYLFAAEEHEEAALLLTWGIVQLYDAIQAENVDINHVKKLNLLNILSNSALPNTISLNTRLLLRAKQIHIAQALSNNIQYLLDDIELLFEKAGETEATGLIAACGFAVPALSVKNFELSCRFLVKAVNAIPFAIHPDGTRIELLSEITAGSFIWLNLQGVRTAENVVCWCDMVQHMPATVRQQALTDPIAYAGVKILFLTFSAMEETLPINKQDWLQVLDKIRGVKTKAIVMAADFLIAAAAWAEIVVLCEHLHLAERAILLAEETLLQYKEDPRVVFMINNAIGKYLSCLNGKESEAEIWLIKAISAKEISPTTCQMERPNTLLILSTLADKKEDFAASTDYLRQALELLESSSDHSEISIVKYLGDFAIAEWKTGNLKGSFMAIDAAVLRLLSEKANSDEWKSLFSLFGHTAGYMASFINYGNPPKLADNSSYVLPPVGNFNNMKQADLASFYNQDKECVLLSHLIRFAQAVESDERVAYWVCKILEEGHTTPSAAGVVATTIFTILPHLVASGNLSEFFESARSASFTLTGMNSLYARGDHDLLFKELDINAVLGEPESEPFQEAEKRTLELTLIPLVFHLGILKLRARENEAYIEKANNQVSLAISLCYESAAISVLSNDWNEAAELIKSCFFENPALNKIISRSNGYSEDKSTLKCVGYIGASMQNPVDLNNAFRAQMVTFPSFPWHQFQESGYRLLLLPFIEEFWGAAIAQRRLFFTPPAAVETAFKDAQKLPVGLRGRELMDVIANGLGIRHEQIIADSFRKWSTLEDGMRP